MRKQSLGKHSVQIKYTLYIILILSFFLRVSSVLNKDTKAYGKQFLSDGKEETCWNSDQGNQWIMVSFKNPVKIKKVEIKFQGGFASSQVELELIKPDKSSTKVSQFYPEDINSLQTFEIKDEAESCECYRMKFEKMTDFFGRIIIYNLQMYGFLDLNE